MSKIKKGARMPIVDFPVLRIGHTTQNRKTIRLNHILVYNLRLKPSYHIILGTANDRLYIDKCPRCMKRYGFTLTGDTVNALHCSFREYYLPKNIQEGYYNVKWDEKRKLYYADLRELLWEV